MKMDEPWHKLGQRQVIITDDNRGPVVNLAAWIAMTFMILCVLTRVISKYSIVRRPTVDDALIVATMIFAALHTVMLSLMVANGLGRPQETLDDTAISNFQKFGYASQLMYVPALALSKLSTVVYLRALSPSSTFSIVNKALEGFIAIWAISTEISVALQCALPTPWAIITTKCFDTDAFWDATGAFDIITDLAIISLPAYLVWHVQMPRSKKILVFVIFGTRIFITPFTIWRIVTLNGAGSPYQSDQTLHGYYAYLATSVQLNFAIFVACIPFLKPFMESMNSGSYTSKSAPMDSSYGAGSKLDSYSANSGRKTGKPKGGIKLSSISGSRSPERRGTSHSKAPTSVGNFRHEGSSDDDFHFGLDQRDDLGSLRPDGAQHFTHIGRATPEENQARSSIESSSMIIRQTTEWDVRESYEHFKPGDARMPSRTTVNSESDHAEKEWTTKGGYKGHSVL